MLCSVRVKTWQILTRSMSAINSSFLMVYFSSNTPLQKVEDNNVYCFRQLGILKFIRYLNLCHTVISYHKDTLKVPQHNGLDGQK